MQKNILRRNIRLFFASESGKRYSANVSFKNIIDTGTNPVGALDSANLKEKKAPKRSGLLKISLKLRLRATGCEDCLVHLGKLLGHIGMEELIEFPAC